MYGGIEIITKPDTWTGMPDDVTNQMALDALQCVEDVVDPNNN